MGPRRWSENRCAREHAQASDVATRVIEWGYTFPPLDAGGLPTEVVRDQKTIPFEGESIVLTHYGAGHTDTDLIVYFKNADVMQMGDIWWNGHYPFIDYGAGGSIDGMIRWTNECLKIVSGAHHHHSRPWCCWRSRAVAGVSRHAGCRSRKRVALEEARKDLGRSHRRQADRGRLTSSTEISLSILRSSPSWSTWVCSAW